MHVRSYIYTLLLLPKSATFLILALFSVQLHSLDTQLNAKLLSKRGCEVLEENIAGAVASKYPRIVCLLCNDADICSKNVTSGFVPYHFMPIEFTKGKPGCCGNVNDGGPGQPSPSPTKDQTPDSK